MSSKRAGRAPKAAKPKAPAKKTRRGSSVQAEHGAHNPEGAGSKPAPATTTKARAGVAQAAEQRVTPADAGSKPAPRSPDGLNARQRAFVVEYLKDKNATQAYMRVYGSEEASSRANAARLIAKDSVRAEIERLEAEQLARVQAETGITLERTVREIAKVAFHDPRKFFSDDGSLRPITELDDDTAAALAGFDVDEIFAYEGKERSLIGHTKKVKLAQRAPYLDMLMKHLGGFKKDNEQQNAPLAEVARQFFDGLHSGAGRLRHVRQPGRD